MQDQGAPGRRHPADRQGAAQALRGGDRRRLAPLLPNPRAGRHDDRAAGSHPRRASLLLQGLRPGDEEPRHAARATRARNAARHPLPARRVHPRRHPARPRRPARRHTHLFDRHAPLARDGPRTQRPPCPRRHRFRLRPQHAEGRRRRHLLRPLQRLRPLRRRQPPALRGRRLRDGSRALDPAPPRRTQVAAQGRLLLRREDERRPLLHGRAAGAREVAPRLRLRPRRRTAGGSRAPATRQASSPRPSRGAWRTLRTAPPTSAAAPACSTPAARSSPKPVCARRTSSSTNSPDQRRSRSSIRAIQNRNAAASERLGLFGNFLARVAPGLM